MCRLLLSLLIVLPGSVLWAHEPADQATGSRRDSDKPIRALVYSNTAYYRHPDIPAINRWLVLEGDKHGIECDVTEHWKDLQRSKLDAYDILILNNANQLDRVIPVEQRQAVEAWFESGKGIVGLHAALVMQTKWPWLVELGGCDFDSDSVFQRARVLVDPAAKNHPTVRGFGDAFWYQADWTNHTRSVTGLPGFQVLLRVDESTYEPVQKYFQERGGKPMGKDHPIAWTHEVGDSRFFYTELGHDLRSLNTQFGRQHVIEGILWAANRSSTSVD